MNEIDLTQRFPDMNPAKRSPTLFQWNGIGFALHGEREPDRETGTYVTTHWFTVLWVPLFALGAYRVSPAGDAWYVFGKVPTSLPARVWSWVVLLGIGTTIAGVAWLRYTDTPEYKAEKSLERAAERVEEGQLGRAALLYREVMAGSTEHGSSARDALRRLIEGPATTAPIDEITQVYEVAVEFQRAALAEPITKKLMALGLDAVRRHAAQEPAKALRLLGVLERLGDDPEGVAAARFPLLESLVKAQPNDLRHVVELADLYAGREAFQKSLTLLEPHRAELGDGEGARVLGQVYLRVDRPEDALPLLEAHTKTHVSRLASAQKAYGDLVDRLWKRQIELLNEGAAPESFYRKYDQASRAEQDAIVSDYVSKKLDGDRRIYEAAEELEKARRVVPVVLDVGILRLRRVQQMADEAARRRELEAAERAFLSISTTAGESDAYRLYMAQVQYWLGRHEQGRALFDAFLAAHDRSAEALVEVAGSFRLLGSAADARELAEEAYAKLGIDRTLREAAASMRSVCAIDEDDELTWLRRSDKTEPHIASRWNRAEGRRAVREGQRAAAAKHLRAAIDAFEGQPESVANLNDIADSYVALYELGGDREDFRRALKFVERAVKQSPNDSILMGNTAMLMMESAVLDVLGEHVDLEAFPVRGNLALLSHLYADETTRERVWGALRAHTGLKKAVERFEQLLILAPRARNPYESLVMIYSHLRDTDALRSLHGKVKAAKLGRSDQMEEHRRFWREGAKPADRKRLRDDLERQRKKLSALRDKADGTTRGVAAARLVEALLVAHIAGLEIDPEEVVRVAEEARRVNPSAATIGSLEAALALRADRALRASAPAYVALCAGLEHAISPSTMLDLALEHPGALRDQALALEDVHRIGRQLWATWEAFPISASPGEWIRVRAMFPAELEAYTAVLRARPDMAAAVDFHLVFAPHDAHTIVHAYFLKLAEGDPAGAQRVLEIGAAAEAPMPKR